MRPRILLVPCVNCGEEWGPNDLDRRTRLCPGCREEIPAAAALEQPSPADYAHDRTRFLERYRQQMLRLKARLQEEDARDQQQRARFHNSIKRSGQLARARAAERRRLKAVA